MKTAVMKTAVAPKRKAKPSRPSKPTESAAKKSADTANPKYRGRRKAKDDSLAAAGRPLWSGAISFGLVNIPVSLYAAVREQRVSFHMLHDQDKSRLRRRLVCPADGKEVHPEHTVRGYEIEKDRYVVVRDAELEACAPEKSRTIEITDFVQLAEIDPLFYDRPYHVLPQAGASKPYRLLVEAMTRSGRVGLARLVMHEKEHLAALRPRDGLLCLQTMYFGAEVLPTSEIDDLPGEMKVAEPEAKAAGQLVRGMSGAFDAGDYRDEYRECVRAMVEEKAHGDNVVKADDAEPEPEADAKPARGAANLMAALEASLAKARGQSKRGKSA